MREWVGSRRLGRLCYLAQRDQLATRRQQAQVEDVVDAGGVVFIQLHPDIGLGAFATFASTIIFTWASRASVTALPGLSAVGRTAVTIAGGMLLVFVVQATLPAVGGQAVPWHLIGAREWGFAAAYGAGSMALSQILFLIGVAGLGIGVAAMHTNVAPFYVMLFALALSLIHISEPTRPY